MNIDSTNQVYRDVKEYVSDLRTSSRYIIKSKRMKAFILFGAVFYGIIKVIDTYRGELLVVKGVSEEQFAMIFAIMTILAGVAATLSRKIHKKFRNRTLTVISMTFTITCLMIGIVTNIFSQYIVIPIILLMYIVLKMCSAMWYILKFKYITNFSSPQIRNKITFTFELISGIIASLISVMGSIILKKLNIDISFLLFAIIAFVAMIFVLKYMKTRIGLKPKQYKKEDIDMEIF